MKCLFMIAAIAAITLVGFMPSTIARAEKTLPVIVQAQGNAYHNDFMVLSSKRADLRLNPDQEGDGCRFH